MCPAPGRDQLSDTFLGRSVLQQSCYVKFRFSQRNELGAEHSATVAARVLPPRVCGSIRCSCSIVFTTSRPRPRNKLPFVGCRKCVLKSRFVFGRCVRATRSVRGRSTDGVLSPRVSVFHAPCLLYLLQHSQSCSKLNTGDVISMFTSLFPVHMS